MSKKKTKYIEQLEDAAYALSRNIQDELEQHDGWIQYEFFTVEIDLYLLNKLFEILGSKDHARSSELLRRFHNKSKDAHPYQDVDCEEDK